MKPDEFSQAIVRSLPADSREPGWLQRFCRRCLARLLARLDQGRLELTLPGGEQLSAGSPASTGIHAELRLHNFHPLRRLWQDGLVGLAEGYIAGEWDSPDLTGLVLWALGNESAFGHLARGSAVSAALGRLRHRARHNSRRGSRRNIAFHYDLGNDFYRLWLDPTMTYSSALFRDPDQDLESAQRNKYRRICELLDVQPRHRVLEIGCGWGGFAATAAAEYGAHVDAVTLSRQQLAWAGQRRRGTAWGARCRFSLTDYRDLNGHYDRIASIEMFEAVGESHWPCYFDRLRRCLKPGGQALLQVISIADERFDHYRRNADFIQRYIFPGGMLPSRTRLRQEFERAGLDLMHEETFGDHYALTLAHWRRAFLANWSQIEALGFDRRFRRLWLYYLAYCEGGFRHGSIDVGFYLLRAP